MKKTVYECGDGDCLSECEICYSGRMMVVEPSRSSMSGNSAGYEGLLGIDLVSMMELTGDMAEKFIKNGDARSDTLNALDEVVRATREYLKVMSRGNVVV